MTRYVASTLLLLVVGCSAAPQVTIIGDASITGRNIQHFRGGKSPTYGALEELQETLGALPPPPPRITVISGSTGAPGSPVVPPTLPTNPTINPNVYNPLLQIIQNGPGGGAISLPMLQQVTPAAMGLVNFLLQNQNQFSWSNPQLAFQQIISTPQGANAYNLAYQLLQPLGFWSYNMLQQWINYILPQYNSVYGVLLNLYNQLLIPLPPATPGSPGSPAVPGTAGTPDQTIIHIVNPVEVISEIMDLYWGRDWVLFGERAPKLADLLLRPNGFSKTRILLYGSRGRWYAPAATTSRREDGVRRAYNINQEGFFTNDHTSGSGLFYQGEDDISLVYVPIEIKDGKVKTLDVIASDRYALLKRASGGDLNLLDRASTFSTGLLQADVALGEDHSIHLRPFVGSTPFATTGGLAAEIEYGSGLFTGRIGGLIGVEDGYYNDSESLIGYLETENIFSTPKLKITNGGAGDPLFELWGSETLAAAGIATRALTTPRRAGERTWVRWGGQGDARAVTEAHSRLDTAFIEFNLYAGLTIAAAPYGEVDLGNPHHSIRPYPIRWHIGGGVRLKISKIYDSHKQADHNKETEKGVQEWWTDKEKQDYRDTHGLVPTPEWIFLSFQGVSEFSRLYRKTRLNLSLELADFMIGGITELDDYLDEDFQDVRIGGGLSWRGFYVQGLKSIKDEDYRLQFGFEFIL